MLRRWLLRWEMYKTISSSLLCDRHQNEIDDSFLWIGRNDSIISSGDRFIFWHAPLGDNNRSTTRNNNSNDFNYDDSGNEEEISWCKKRNVERNGRYTALEYDFARLLHLLCTNTTHSIVQWANHDRWEVTRLQILKSERMHLSNESSKWWRKHKRKKDHTRHQRVKRTYGTDRG